MEVCNVCPCGQIYYTHNILFYLGTVGVMCGFLCRFFNIIYIQQVYVQIHFIHNNSHGNDLCDCPFRLIAWGSLLICCIFFWLKLILFVLHCAATCPGLRQEKFVIFFTRERNLLLDLPNFFNLSLWKNELFSNNHFFVSFFVPWCCCLFLFISLKIMLLMASPFVGPFWAASLSSLMSTFSAFFIEVTSSSSCLHNPLWNLNLFLEYTTSVHESHIVPRLLTSNEAICDFWLCVHVPLASTTPSKFLHWIFPSHLLIS